MVIATANGAIAAKLKQMLPRLLESFGEKYCQNKKQYQEVTAISVIVQPEFFVAESQRRVSLPRQPMPYQKLLELAESLEDSPLKTALDSIASKNKRTLTNKENKR